MPILGTLPVSDMDTGAVMRVLEPIWRKKTETASRLRGRIESVLDYATARELASRRESGSVAWPSRQPATGTGKVAKVEHHAALPWREIGAFMATLMEQEGVAALALRFAILTAARTGEVIGATWREIYMAAPSGRSQRGG